MKTIGLDCTKYYEVGESIFAIDSRKFPMHIEIKDFYACISLVPHVKTILMIIVADLPLAYSLRLGRE